MHRMPSCLHDSVIVLALESRCLSSNSFLVVVSLSLATSLDYHVLSCSSVLAKFVSWNEMDGG